jgi:hydroxymethylbilane synthase
MTSRLVIGSRGSKLALWQSNHVAERLSLALGPHVEIVVEVLSTKGDRVQDRPLPEIGGKGLFTAELEAALRSGEIDIAVHSLKDLLTEDPEGIVLGAIPKRVDPRDALVVRRDHLETLRRRMEEDPEGAASAGPFAALAAGAILGTSSIRRSAQAKWVRPDLQVSDVRGNVDTRLRKLDEGGYDALLLACAGLDRLGWSDRISVRLPPPWLGAAGQGALAIQARLGDTETLITLQALEHKPSRLEVEAERSVLASLGGGCSMPLAIRAQADGARLSISARVLSLDGSEEATSDRGGEATREGAARLGRLVARELVDRGAGRLLGWGVSP